MHAECYIAEQHLGYVTIPLTPTVGLQYLPVIIEYNLFGTVKQFIKVAVKKLIKNYTKKVAIWLQN